MPHEVPGRANNPAAMPSASVKVFDPIRVPVHELLALQLPKAINASWNLERQPMPSDALVYWVSTFGEGGAAQVSHLLRGLLPTVSDGEDDEAAQAIMTFVTHHLRHPLPSHEQDKQEVMQAFRTQQGRRELLARFEAHVGRERSPSQLGQSEGLHLPAVFLEREENDLVVPTVHALIRQHFEGSPIPPERRSIVCLGGHWSLPFALLQNRQIGATTIATDDKALSDKLFADRERPAKSRILESHWNEQQRDDIDSRYFPGDITFVGRSLETMPKQCALQAIDWMYNVALQPGGRLIIMLEKRTPDIPSLEHLCQFFHVQRPASIDATDVLQHLQERGIPTADQLATLRMTATLPRPEAYVPFTRTLLGRHAPSEPGRIDSYAQHIHRHGAFTHALTVLVTTKQVGTGSAQQERRPPEKALVPPPFGTLLIERTRALQERVEQILLSQQQLLKEKNVKS